MSGFGKAKYEKEGSGFKKRQTLKVGHNVRRILPPFGSLAASGKWSLFGSQHFGWFIENTRDPEKPIPKPFRCVKKSKRVGGETMILEECAACVELEDKKRELEQIVADCKRDNLTREQTEERTDFHNEWLRSHNLDKKWYMNTMLEDGSFELTAISNTCYWRLDELIKTLRNEDRIDPLDPEQGVWIDFTRTLPNNSKNLRDADDVPVLVYETVIENGRKFKMLKPAPLTDEQIENALAECVDLGGLMNEISPEMVNQLVACSGDPAEVAAIFGLPQKDTRAEASPKPVARQQLQTPKAPFKAQQRQPEPEPAEDAVEEEVIEVKSKSVQRRVAAQQAPQEEEELAPIRTGPPKALLTRPGVKTPADLMKAKKFAADLFGDDDGAEAAE